MSDEAIAKSRQQFAIKNPSVVSNLSKARSQASLRLRDMENKRAENFNSDLTLKLSYAWKHVYRSLLQNDVLQKGKVTGKQFNQALIANNVMLTKEEIRRLIKLSHGSNTQTQ